MCTISTSSRSESGNSSSGQDGVAESTTSCEGYYQDIVANANTISLSIILDYYNVFLSPGERKCPCPFPYHKGGHERTPSFYIYPDTNTFWCFGCKTGVTPVDFVVAMESITRDEAAIKITNIFNKDIDVKKTNLLINNINDRRNKLKLLNAFQTTLEN